MDEGLLNDLLECSVCLERLDTSSRVLPCQHTFCLKCLKVIVESHKELRCPECRVLVEAKVEELPPNVLLMRILEGMKNSAPRKVSAQRVRTAHAQGQVRTQPLSRSDEQVPPHGRAMYDYISKEPGDLSFKKGETILLLKKLDPFWYHGECSGRSGVFPITYLQVIVPLAAAPALCKALYDFRMSAPDEEGCLAFDKGAIITVHRRVDENWAEGRLEQRVGIFPIAFVELNQAASHLMNGGPINRPVPPAPEHVRAGHSEHRHQVQHPHRYQQMTASTPASAQGNYQNAADASQSRPSGHATSQTATRPSQTSGPTSARRAPSPRIAEPTRAKYLLDIVHFTSAHKALGVQSASRVDDNYDRFGKFDNHSNGADVAHQHVRTERFPGAGFNSNLSSDSSSGADTPSSTTTPTTSSDTSTSESAEPSLPDSPDDDAERNATVAAPEDDRDRTRDPSREPRASAAPNSSECSTATNTSLNVSLPTESSHVEAREAEPTSPPRSSRITRSAGPEARCSGPNSLLNFGLGLQAALSPSRGRDDYAATRAPRDHHHREKRHSLTPTTHLQGGHNQNRHSAEILATSLLDHTPERDVRGERERRRRRSRSDERPLPAAYVALYPYRPQKPDEIELKKGGVYTVRERCRDGWYKGWCERLQRAGVFPGNYVAPLTPVANRIKHDKSASISSGKTAPPASDGGNSSVPSAAPAPPDAPPRADSPPAAAPQPSTYPWSAPTQSQQGAPRADKAKEKAKSEKSSISSGVSLMKRLAAMKKCKSPPPVGYSMDNPVFDDSPDASLVYAARHPVHVRSGSCPSQLLRASPAGQPSAGQIPAPAGLTVARHKERPHDHRMLSRGSNEGLRQNQHRKSQSLDVTAARRDRHHSQPVKERFRCVVPYPPNSEYELELKVDDIVTVCKKRGDGWYKGTLQRTGRTGLFPASFVQSCPPE